MKTFTEYPRCEKHGLLRTLGSGAMVVSSEALYKHLGWDDYQKFIHSIQPHHEPNMGFWPETVERFLRGPKV